MGFSFLSKSISAYCVKSGTEIYGMDRYKQNARNTQQKFSLPGEDYTQNMSICNHTLDVNANIQPQTDANAGIEGTIPDPLDVWKNIYPPHLLYPPQDNVINLYGDFIDLNQLESNRSVELFYHILILS